MNRFPNNKKIMGVSIRAEYRRDALLKLDIIKGHPKVGSCEYYIDTIQKKMSDAPLDVWICGAYMMTFTILMM